MTNKMISGRRRVLGWAGALPALAALRPFAAMAAGSAPVRIVNPQSDYNSTILQILGSDGYFKEFGLEPTFTNVSDSAKILAALISGSSDICCGGGFSGVFPAIARGAKVKIIAGGEIAPLTVLFSKNPNIRSAKDLVGKTVGTGAPGTLLYQLVVALLQKEGVDYHSVNFLNVGSSPDVFRAVLAGTVDAGPGEIGYTARAKEYGVHMLDDGNFSDQLPLFTNQAFLASEQAIAEKRDVLVRTLAVHAKLFRYLSTPASEATWLSARKIALNQDRPAEAKTQWQFFQHPNRLDTNLLLTQAQTDYMQTLNVEFGLQKKILPFDQVADMSLAQDALKLLA